MATPILSDRDHSGVARILNLPNAVSPQEPATLSQLSSAVEGLAWKDSARVATQGNINLTAPGASIDGVAMAVGDRVLVRSQTAGSENGIYIWNGASVAMARSLDANTSDELEQATVSVEEGTSANATFRQTTVNFVLGTGAVSWTSFGTAAASASETTAGVAEIATQAETDAGSDDARIVTPLKLKSSPFVAKRYSATIGDGTATQYTVTHNLNTRDLHVAVYRASDGVEVVPDIARSSINAVLVSFAAAPANNQYRVVVIA